MININIDELNPCADCKTKQCGLIDGNECKKQRKFAQVEQLLHDLCSYEEDILGIYDTIKNNTYKCEICGEIIFPTIISSGSGDIDVAQESAKIIYGKGNSVLHKKVCSKYLSGLSIKKG